MTSRNGADSLGSSVPCVEMNNVGCRAQSFQKMGERGTLGIIGAVVAQMTCLAQGAQIGRAVVGRIVIEMGAGQNHRRLRRREQASLPVQHTARFTAPPRTNEANVVADRGPMQRIEMFDLCPVRHTSIE